MSNEIEVMRSYYKQFKKILPIREGLTGGVPHDTKSKKLLLSYATPFDKKDYDLYLEEKNNLVRSWDENRFRGDYNQFCSIIKPLIDRIQDYDNVVHYNKYAKFICASKISPSCPKKFFNDLNHYSVNGNFCSACMEVIKNEVIRKTAEKNEKENEYY
ncbi:hypothetical protein EKK58_06070 [Candidatus Dependentiae bacterium]|nr:MAG: hypothetical protein EKK58_06070 [Candidatus Dependentiae bacterium]